METFRRGVCAFAHGFRITVEAVVCGRYEALEKLYGVKGRRRMCDGGVAVKNELSVPARLAFRMSRLPNTTLEVADVNPGNVYVYQPDQSTDFDFLLTVNSDLHAMVLRGGTYTLSSSGAEVKLALDSPQLSPPPKRDLLSSVEGLTFGFSASGWLFIYQLGVGACLQDHGIASNRHVRVVGSSGGALTAVTMMCGCDMRALRDEVKLYADVSRHCSEPMNMRHFILEAMKTMIRDGFVEHPVLREGRVEISVTESGTEATTGPYQRLRALCRNQSVIRVRRLKHFGSVSELAVALLASSSMGLSGLPLIWKNEDGREVHVADGAFTDFLPTYDETTVRVRPFLDPLGFTSRSPDVEPSEYVSLSYAFWPPNCATLDHLFELGYRDTEDCGRAGRGLQCESAPAQRHVIHIQL